MTPRMTTMLRTFRGILSLQEKTQALCLICDTGDEMIIHETTRTKGLRLFLWEPVIITGLVRIERFKKILEVIDFSTQEDPPETISFEDEAHDPRLAYEGEPLPLSGFAASIAS